jgi:hypothetical protein
MPIGRVVTSVFVLAVIMALPGDARAEFRRIDMKIVGMD